MRTTLFPDISTVTWSWTRTTGTGRTLSSTWRRSPTRPTNCCRCSTRRPPSSTSPPFPPPTGRTPPTAWHEVRVLEEAGRSARHQRVLLCSSPPSLLCASSREPVSFSQLELLKVFFPSCRQCWESADPYLWIMDLDPAFFSRDLQNGNNNKNLAYYFLKLFKDKSH